MCWGRPGISISILLKGEILPSWTTFTFFPLVGWRRWREDELLKPNTSVSNRLLLYIYVCIYVEIQGCLYELPSWSLRWLSLLSIKVMSFARREFHSIENANSNWSARNGINYERRQLSEGIDLIRSLNNNAVWLNCYNLKCTNRKCAVIHQTPRRN